MRNAWRTTKKRVAIFVVVGIVGVVAGIAVANAATTGRTAPVAKFVGIDEIVQQCTTSTSYVTMPQMIRTFSLGGSGNDEAVVTFSGSVSLDDSGGSFDTGFIRLIIDGVQQTPGEVPFTGVNQAGARSFTFQTNPVTTGALHSARIQWRTDLGSNFCVDARSLIVLSK
jgi:hypothetical protein